MNIVPTLYQVITHTNSNFMFVSVWKDRTQLESGYFNLFH